MTSVMSAVWIIILALTITVVSPYPAYASPYVKRCLTRYFQQPKDHFSFRADAQTFKHRVLYNLDSYRSKGPIFFYLGNEADVELYVDHSGLMWENAKRFGAALVFAEHRYYGKSRLFADDSCDMSLLTTEQALADYAVVVDTFKHELNASAVIGFGGSYGGMLATTFKFQYSHMVDGIIAASAPVLAYNGLNPPYDSNGFARVVTRDAGPKCAALVRKGLEAIFNLTQTDAGRSVLSKQFRLCKALETQSEAEELLAWTSSYWDYLAMGDFPYPSRYVQPEGGMLPAYPVKAACHRMVTAADPITGLILGADMFYNATKTKKCFFNEPRKRLSDKRLMRAFPLRFQYSYFSKGRACEGDWDWQWCTEHSMPFTSGTADDMFYPPTGPFDPAATAQACKTTWGVEPNPLWARLTYGGLHGLQRGLRNVVFSNGMLDPWSAGGVLDTSGFHPSVAAVLIPHGAHHLDLMFSNEADPLDVIIARKVELKHIAKWINEARVQAGLVQENFPSIDDTLLDAGSAAVFM